MIMDQHTHMWGHGHHWGASGGLETLFSMLTTLFVIALLIGLAWAIWKWISPYLLPRITAILYGAPAEPSALEILRRRYAAGEIDAVTFEQMWERLEASYRPGEMDIPPVRMYHPLEIRD